jgi:outer membrane protein assembly factor BamB
VCIILMVLAGAVSTAETTNKSNTVQLLRETNGEWLTPHVTLSRKTPTGLVELKSPAQLILLDSNQTSFGTPGHVSVVTKVTGGVQVQLYDGQGKFILQSTQPEGVFTTAFAGTIAAFRPGLHEPELAYSIDLISPDGVTHIERDGREVIDIRAIENHLVVSSVSGNENGDLTADVIDAAGKTVWSFNAPWPATPRVVADGQRAAAIFARKGSSLLQIAQSGRKIELAFDGPVMTNIAFLVDGSGLFIWGRQIAVLVDPATGAQLWRTNLSGGIRQLANATSFITPVSGAIATVVRQRMENGDWRVGVTFLNQLNGSRSDYRWLYESTERPTLVNRYDHDGAELLVTPQRIYKISTPIRER